MSTDRDAIREWVRQHTPQLDDRDRDMIAERAAKYALVEGPRVGDWIDFPNGARQRVSHVWDNGVQTSKGGTFYLGPGHVSFSGGLDPVVPFEKLTLTGEVRAGRIWVFHHDMWSAGNGVESEIEFRVYQSAQHSPTDW